MHISTTKKVSSCIPSSRIISGNRCAPQTPLGRAGYAACRAYSEMRGWRSTWSEWCAGIVTVTVLFFQIFHFAARDALAMLPVVPIRRCGSGVARLLEWCEEVVTVIVSFFEFSISGYHLVHQSLVFVRVSQFEQITHLVRDALNET